MSSSSRGFFKLFKEEECFDSLIYYSKHNRIKVLILLLLLLWLWSPPSHSMIDYEFNISPSTANLIPLSFFQANVRTCATTRAVQSRSRRVAR